MSVLNARKMNRPLRPRQLPKFSFSFSVILSLFFEVFFFSPPSSRNPRPTGAGESSLSIPGGHAVHFTLDHAVDGARRHRLGRDRRRRGLGQKHGLLALLRARDDLARAFRG